VPADWLRHVRLRAVRVPLRLALPLVVATLVGVGYLLLFSHLFLARGVSVTGTSRVSSQEVRQAARVPSGVPLARLDTGAIARRVAALPAVAAVDVRRHFPHSVRIRVSERVPLLAVPRPAGFSLVDRDGVAFGTVNSAPAQLPIVRLATVSRTDPATRAVLSVLQALNPELRAHLQRLNAATGNAVTLYLRDGRRVVWGSADRSVDKAHVLAALLSRKGRVYDISAPNVVTVSG